MSFAGKRPRARFQRFRNRCNHFVAAALPAGRNVVEHRFSRWLLSTDKEQRFSQTNCGGGATPWSLFCSPIQRINRVSSTNLCVSVRTDLGMSSLQSSHCASVFTGVARNRFFILRVNDSTSSSKTRPYFRSIAAVIADPEVGSWQNAIVPTRTAWSRCLLCLDLSFCAARCKRLCSLLSRANSEVISSMATWVPIEQQSTALSQPKWQLALPWTF